MADRTESIILDVEIDAQESIESINSLTAANKELRKERNALNLQTEAGVKRAQQINAAIDANTEKIKNNVSALEKQKINIGNYRSALDGVHPALGKVGEGLEAGTSGFKAMTLQALRFIATPIGAILAALVAVFSLLKAALSSNAELMDKFENVTTAVSSVIDVLVVRAGKLGEALIALATGDLVGAFNKTKEAVTGLGDALTSAVKSGQMWLDMSRDLEDAQRNLGVETAKTENRIKQLEQESKNVNLSLSAQSKLIREALKLQEGLVAKRADNAFKDLVITTNQLVQAHEDLHMTSEETLTQWIDRIMESGKLSGEVMQKIADKQIALEQARGSSLAFQAKLQNDLAALAKKELEATEKQTQALKEQEAQERALQRSKSGDIGETQKEDPLVRAELDRAIQIKDINERLAKDISKINKKQDDEMQKRAEARLEYEKFVEEEKFNSFMQTSSAILGVLDSQSVEYKALASFQAAISAATTAQKAYEAAFTPPTVASPALAIGYVTAAVATGLANIAKINGIQFAEGGWTGPGEKWDAVGIVHADEYVTPKRVVNNPMAQPHLAALERMRLAPYADGGMVTRSISAPINQAMEMANVIKNLPEPVVSVKEFVKVEKQVKVKQNISKI